MSNLKQLQHQQNLLREQRKQSDMLQKQNTLLEKQNRMMAQQAKATRATSGQPDTSFMGTMGKLAGAVGGALGETLSELKEDFRTSGGILSDHVKAEIAKGQQGGHLTGDADNSGGHMGEAKFLPPTGPSNPLATAPVWHQLMGSGKQKVALDCYAHPSDTASLQTYLQTLSAETNYPFTASLIAINLADTPLSTSLLTTFTQALAKVPQLYGSIGYGPRHLVPNLEDLDTHLTALLNSHPKIIAIGPVGLDAPFAAHTLPQQMAQLQLQLEIAADFNLPVFIRNIGATAQLAEVLGSLTAKPRALVYTRPPNTPEEKELIQKHDMHILLRAELTWPEQNDYRQIVLSLPKLRWLLASGNGLTASEAHKGQVNTSATLPYVLQTMSSLTRQDIDTLLGHLNANAYRLFYQE